MRGRWIAAVVLATSALAGAHAQTPQEVAAVARASERGAMLYAYDQAAWHGTDDLIARLPDYRARVGGWIVDGPVAAPRLVFFDKTRTKAVYLAQFTGTRLADAKVLGSTEDSSLSALDRRLIDALAVARAALDADKTVFACAAKPFNTVVLPPATADAPVSVYFLTPQTGNDAVPFGGHYQVDVDSAGRAGPVRRFTNTCLNMPTHPNMPAGAKAEYLAVSHLLDATPTEIHVFSSLAIRMPVMVITPGPPGRIWPVNGAHVSTPVELEGKVQ